ncbi:isochorismatase [Mycobacterium dioxanotrophicus]|jgi:nicotinamidase-related amidase|uniref:Isochorismatase n=1 Tax=Mycobacterium dioxanotrophicus TaxID=482462 RepID=A0A1Y0C924_9MYCO|nr:isochorismatase family cysteine hydrolase [Mycobacterium dioxanotrophicus]ART71587.1 isochorismatase [Mycobacterium dioxanotrophicus]
MSDAALLIIDMFNDYRHEDADQLAANVAQILGPLQRLQNAAREHRAVDIVYVNDNHGNFNASGHDIVRSAQRGRHPELVEPLLPTDGCAFLTKVRHSVFYATALDYLLQRLGTKTLVLAGQVTEQCILYSALDAYLRHFDVVIPADAVAHIDENLGTAALEMMRRNMDARIVESAHCLPTACPPDAAQC